MIYSILEQQIYRNSRYALVQLLEDIYPTEQGKFKSADAFDDMANAYEFLVNKYFPKLPLSEERLAIFLRVYSEQGFVSTELENAMKSNNREVIFLVLKNASNREYDLDENLQKRRFYEALIFGDE